MIRLHVQAASSADTSAALARLDAMLAADNACRAPRMVFAFYGCAHDDVLIHRHLSDRYARAPLLGGTSSGGLMTQHGVLDRHAIGLLLIDDEDGSYGSASGPLGDDASLTAQRLLKQALANAGCTGELPELIWIFLAPGREEAVIDGLRRVVGDRCPIVGGSSADDDVTGHWRQLGPDGPIRDGLVVAVLLPSAPVGHAFQGGYEPTGDSGVVTEIAEDSAGREILTIDDEPAAAVYNRWSNGRIDSQLDSGGPILAATTLCPIATDAGRAGSVSHYLLVHPESVGAAGSLRTFCNVAVGSRVYAMKGDRKRLVDRAGRVAAQAVRALPVGHNGIAGAIVVYCGGCKFAIGDDIVQVSGAVAQGLGDAPFIGCFTFGEQGPLLERNVHGNLMISATVFSQ